jgi:hypothetical protein
MVKLFGNIIAGSNFFCYESSPEEFRKYKGKEKDFKKIIESKFKPFKPESNIKPSKTNTYLITVSDQEVWCYQYFKKGEGNPEGYFTDNELTKYIKSKVGIKKIL